MALIPLRLVKNWIINTVTGENNWDEIADNVSQYTGRNDSNLKQIGLDIDGANYAYNNVGRATQTSSIIARLNLLELTQGTVGFRNLGLDTNSTGAVKLTSGSGTALSGTNIGEISFNSEANAGQSISRNVTSDLSVTLTGAHWGLGTLGDFSDIRLWLYLIDDNGTIRFGVSMQGGREFVASSDTTATPTSANSEEKILVNSTLTSGDGPALTLGWFKADFDDTGNAGGEDFWTPQTGLGDINLEKTLTFLEGTFEF